MYVLKSYPAEASPVKQKTLTFTLKGNGKRFRIAGSFNEIMDALRAACPGGKLRELLA